MKKNIFIIFIQMLIVVGISAQSVIDISSLPNDSNKNIIDEDLTSKELISQINKLDELINKRNGNLKVDVIEDKETYPFNLLYSNVGEKLSAKYGANKPVDKRFNCYSGDSNTEKHQSHSFTFSDELGNFGFSFEKDGVITSLVKEINSKIGIRYSYTIKQMSQEKTICSLTDENTLQEDSFGSETKSNSSNHTEYILEIGAGTDFEYLVADNFNIILMFLEIIGEAASVSTQYESCDMRVDIRLINIVFEIFDNTLWPTPYCNFWNNRTKAFSYNQIFAASPARPDGDVITLFTGTDLRGAFCLGSISGMANLINGACGFRKTAVAEANRGWGLWAHEIGHVIGVGINHGNLPNGFFYSDNGSTLTWHPNTIDKVHSKMDNKGCIEKINNCCLSNFNDVDLCANATTFCIPAPTCARLDISNYPTLSISGGQLCGTVSGNASYSIPTSTLLFDCPINVVTLQIYQCEGSVTNYSVPPYGMHELCYDDVEDTCYDFNCVSSWEIGSHTGLFVSSTDGELCVAPKGIGGAGPKILNVRPTFSCGVVGDWLQWTINVVNCLTDNDKDDTASSRKSSSQTTIKFINATSVEIRNNDSSVPTLVEFFTLAGQKIGSQSYNSNGIFNLPELPAGITLGVFYVDGKPVVRKIIN